MLFRTNRWPMTYNYRRYIDTNLRGSPDEACFWVFFFRMYWSIGSSSRSTAFRWASRSSSSTDRAIGLSISCKSLAILAFWLSNCFNLKIISTFSYYLKGCWLLIFDILHHQKHKYICINQSFNFFLKIQDFHFMYYLIYFVLHSSSAYMDMSGFFKIFLPLYRCME